MYSSSARHIDSYYTDSSLDHQRAREPLRESMAADVCVIGAGFFGLYTAMELAQSGKRVVVLEASRVGWGASGRNGGQLTVGLPCDMNQLASAIGHERAKHLFQASCAAVRDIRQRVSAQAIDCDFVDGHLEVAVLPRRVADLQRWVDECRNKWAYDNLQFVDKSALADYLVSPRYQAGIVSPEGGHFHPLKYNLGLASFVESLGVGIFEQSRAEAYVQRAGHIDVCCGPHVVRCDQLVLAANAYIDRLDSRLARRILPVGTFMIATEPLTAERARKLIPRNHAVFDNQFILEYFRRSADHRILFGGKCSYLGGTPKDLKASMKRNLLRAFPSLADVKIDYAWGGHIDVTMRRLPDWGRHGDSVFWAQGFCGHGVVATRLAATLIAQAALGKPEELDWLAGIVTPTFPGGELLGGLMQAAGMSYYRLRDFF